MKRPTCFRAINNGLSVTQSVRYNINTNGWNGDYQPGTSWASSSGTYHFDMDFKISYQLFPPPPAGIEESVLADFRLYPNPATEMVMVESAVAATLEVHDLSGRLVRTERVQAGVQSVDVSDLAQGMYQLRVVAGEAQRLEKLVIQR